MGLHQATRCVPGGTQLMEAVGHRSNLMGIPGM